MVRLSGMKRRSSGAKSVTVTKMVTKPASKPSFSSSYIPRAIVPGITRQSGFYGRFNQSPNSGKPEDKFFDTLISTAFDSTGEVIVSGGQLCLIPQGVTESTRVGRKCTVKSIQLRGAYNVNSAAAATGTYMYLVQDTQCNGAAAAVTDVLTSTTLSIAMINMANSGRFRILKRFVANFNPAAGVAGTTNGAYKSLDWFMKCNIPLEFSSTTGAITELKSNNLFLIAGSGNGVDDLVTFDGRCRIKFSDA